MALLQYIVCSCVCMCVCVCVCVCTTLAACTRVRDVYVYNTHITLYIRMYWKKDVNYSKDIMLMLQFYDN